MGGCATKPKVEESNLAPAPVVTEDRVENDVVAETNCSSREQLIVGEINKDEGEALSRRQSLSNLLNNPQIAEEKGKSESSNGDNSLEKVAQLSGSPKKEHPSDSAEQVPTEAIGTSDGLKADLTEAELTKLTAPDVATSEILKLSEADTRVNAAASETLTIETPKPSEVIKTEAVAPSALPVSESLKLSDDTNTKEAATEAPKLGTPKPSEVTKTEGVPPVVEVLKSEVLKLSDVTNTDTAAAPVVQKTPPLEPANATKKEDANTLKPAESSKATDASDVKKSKAEVK